MLKQAKITRREDHLVCRPWRGTRVLTLLAAITAVIALANPSPTRAVCSVGDCNGDNEVTVDEITTGTNIALGDLPVSACPAFDSNHDGAVTVDELTAAVNLSLNGCPGCWANHQETQACGNCNGGTQTRTCNSSGTAWGSWGSCNNQPCAPGDINTQGCGSCGTQSQTCSSACQWGSFGTCTGQHGCAPGSRQYNQCGTNSNNGNTCQGNCTWGQCACFDFSQQVQSSCNVSFKPAGYYLHDITLSCGSPPAQSPQYHWWPACGYFYKACAPSHTCQAGGTWISEYSPTPTVDHCDASQRWVNCSLP